MFKHSLKQILSSFEKTIQQLEALETSNLAAVDTNQKVVQKIQEQSAALSTEAASANRIAGNLRKILTD
jgi:hypothetical protein